MSEPKQSNQLFKGSMLFLVPERMKIENAALNIVYDIETGKEHESIAPILLDYDPLERIKELESGIKEVQAMVDDRESMQTLGLMMLGPISRKIKQLLEK